MPHGEIGAVGCTEAMVLPRFGRMVRSSGTGKASRLPKRSTPGCANNLRVPDFIFVAFFFIEITKTIFFVFPKIGIFIDLALRCTITGITAEHRRL